MSKGESGFSLFSSSSRASNSDDSLVIDICYGYSYFEVFGLTSEEFTELEKYYKELKNKARNPDLLRLKKVIEAAEADGHTEEELKEFKDAIDNFLNF